MIKALKGTYNPETSYSVGDVVLENEHYYLLQKAASAGTHPFDTRFWGMITDPDTVDALNLVGAAQSAAEGAASDELESYFPDAKTLVLASSTASSTKKFKITVVDAGTISASEITG